MSEVEVFADVCCPFTHVGLNRLVRRRHEVACDITLRVPAWPLELVNGAPLDAGLIAEEVDELRHQVAPDLFAGFDRARFPASSLPALEMAAAGYQRDVASGERISLLLRDALFEQGRDIANLDELARIADVAGLRGPFDAAGQVLDEWHEGQQRGVIGSPHFFVDDTDYFCPSLLVERIDGHLHITFDGTRFDEFFDRCASG